MVNRLPFQTTLAFLVAITLGWHQLQSQDLHFFQFQNTPMHISPALTGGFLGDVRVTAAYRNQWSTVPSEFETITGSAELNFCNSCHGYSPYSLGLVFTNDVAGLSNLGLTQVSASGAIRRPIFTRHEISLGLMAGIGQRRFDSSQLFSNARIQDNGFTPVYDEISVDNNFIFFDLAAGINTRWKGTNDRSFVDVGVGFYHLNRYNTSFFDNVDSPQAIRYNMYFFGSLRVGQRVDLIGQGLASIINKQEEVLLGTGARIFLNNGDNFWKRFGIEVMGSFRWEDAIIPSFGVLYRSWYVGYSHDITTSPLSSVRNGGSPEFTLRYTFRPINVPFRRICPISL